jgi:hypothetical protein
LACNCPQNLAQRAPRRRDQHQPAQALCIARGAGQRHKPPSLCPASHTQRAPVRLRAAPAAGVGGIIVHRHRIGIGTAPALANMPRLSIRTLAMPRAATLRQQAMGGGLHAQGVVAIAVWWGPIRAGSAPRGRRPLRSAVPRSGPCGPGASIALSTGALSTWRGSHHRQRSQQSHCHHLNPFKDWRCPTVGSGHEAHMVIDINLTPAIAATPSRPTTPGASPQQRAAGAGTHVHRAGGRAPARCVPLHQKSAPEIHPRARLRGRPTLKYSRSTRTGIRWR